MEELTKFRESIYTHFPVRTDATMNLFDAVSSYGHVAKSVVQLSEAPCFERRYSSITDAISDGLPNTDWGGIESLVYKSCFDESKGVPSVPVSVRHKVI